MEICTRLEFSMLLKLCCSRFTSVISLSCVKGIVFGKCTGIAVEYLNSERDGNSNISLQKSIRRKDNQLRIQGTVISLPFFL